jgi:hypothetical protein
MKKKGMGQPDLRDFLKLMGIGPCDLRVKTLKTLSSLGRSSFFGLNSTDLI